MALRPALVAGLLLGKFAAAYVKKREAGGSVAETSFVERAVAIENDFKDAPELEARGPKKGKGKKGKGKGKKGTGKGKGKGKKRKADCEELFFQDRHFIYCDCGAKISWVPPSSGYGRKFGHP
ncbi:hypothetical protein B0T26DRAFT_681328 [Lasiosphaeria miniovina]|uniref:Uncharacterized protein n=1 Tax=Lasiosphaeria miniovina TaxID=1954250 RepID=A0AA40DKZ3_9PEZI|nr:uncharacterized protein B0T26DRAFT_681328 [Lasiosphaeria miniovina]KAK0703683.1 hypothetical protein B0T26DRAFT_681328 [Lasiosphaeria miniovina]